ncbi:MAG: hypothetical protein ACFBWO_09230 [Paracoccaceae bacterium]
MSLHARPLVLATLLALAGCVTPKPPPEIPGRITAVEARRDTAGAAIFSIPDLTAVAAEDGYVYKARPHSPVKPDRAFVLAAKALEAKNAEFSAHVQRGDVHARAGDRFLDRFADGCLAAAEDIAAGRTVSYRIARQATVAPDAPEATLRLDVDLAEIGEIEQKTRSSLAGKLGVAMIQLLGSNDPITRVRGRATLVETATGRTLISTPFHTGAASKNDSLFRSEDLTLICRRMLPVLAR